MDKKEQVEKYAGELLKLARDTITVRFRFFDNALAKIKTEFKHGLFGAASVKDVLYIDPAFLLREYMEEPNIAVRIYMHIMLHYVFLHQYQYDKLNAEFWNLASDIAVENIILEMEFQSSALKRDGVERDKIAILKKRVPSLTADKIYREFMVNDLSNDTKNEYKKLFSVDIHEGWHTAEKKTNEMVISEEDWKKISRRIKADLKTFSRNKTASESLEKNIDRAIRERYNYRQILERFMVLGEEITVNEDEFDYIYYTYGLSEYGNMPLIEPLEYKEDKKVKEFVIAIDTSASCRGEVVKAFVRKTYEILKNNENFFRKVNVHIVQCDNEVRSDIKIESEEDFRDFIDNGKIIGMGSTDFRPVFDYVEKLEEAGEFENLQGLIYFTDGYGIYPSNMPKFETIFAFLNEDETRMPVPGWAIKVIMEDELNEY